MSVVGLLLAIGGAFLTRSADAAQVLAVSGALSVYAGLLVNWHTAVQRVSGAPTVWFTALVPVIVAVSVSIVAVGSTHGPGAEGEIPWA